MAATIAVYADWIGLTGPLRLGLLHARSGAGREVFEFEFDRAALVQPSVASPHMDSRLGQFASRHHTFLVKRFDRTPEGRLHFASAMTLTGPLDGDDASTGASYLEIARVLIDHGARTVADLRELWSRIVFNMLVSNTDDHLRDHGFIFVPGKGWRLSEAYDMNPVPEAHGLTLNVSAADNDMDLDLVRSVAPYFRVSKKLGNEIIERGQAVVKQWPKIAGSLRVNAREQERMAPAFRLAG